MSWKSLHLLLSCRNVVPPVRRYNLLANLQIITKKPYIGYDFPISFMEKMHLFSFVN